MSFIKPALRFNYRTRLPLFLQHERMDCGHACLAMISHFLGHRLQIIDLKVIDTPSNRGTTLLELSELAERLGFLSRPLQVPLEELHLVKCPAILHWDMNHFVVLKQVKKNKIIIHDPAIGVRHCSWVEVTKSFTGIVLEIDKANDFKAMQGSQRLSLWQLVKTIHGIQFSAGLLLLLSLIIEILSLFNPLFMQYVTDNVIGFNEQQNLYVIAGGFLILVFIQSITEFGRGTFVTYFTNHLTEQFSANVMKHLLSLPLVFFEKRHKGDLQAKFQSIDYIQKKISIDFVNALLDGLMVFINLAVMLAYNCVLTAIVLGALSLFLAVRYASYQQLKKQNEISIVQHAKAASTFLETLQGIVPIKLFLKERARFNVWRNGYIDALNADIRVSTWGVWYQVTYQLVSHVEHIVVVCVGASLVLYHQFSLGMLIAFLAYRLSLVNKASSLMQHFFDYKLVSIQLNRLSDILFQVPEVTSLATLKMSNSLQGALTLRDVTFQYHPHERPILNKVNIQVKAGEKVAIVGPSGCGKSTLIKVMMGLLAQQGGEILIDDIPIMHFGLKQYRDRIASVMQEDTLLSGSILDNIVFFEECRDMDRVCQAAEVAHIHDIIAALPMGYETLVGDMGSILSGGQKQRLLLARALYKQPKILFLDEATSHLDQQNERSINNALQPLAMTQIIIAHRKETIAMADKVVNWKDLM